MTERLPMFQKIHYRLTFLCAGITAFILLAMSCIYLYVSESGLKQNQFLAFQRDMSTITANFEQQTIFTHEWLSKIENSNSYFITVTDNGVPFLFNERNGDAKRKTAEEEALACYRSGAAAGTANPLSDYNSYHREFEFTASDGEEYYACFAGIPRENGTIEVLILSSLTGLRHQIRTQRIRFVLLDIVSVALLALFSYFFTKKLLAPIEQGRREQNEFIASASHELRTPLAVILSCASACEKASPGEQNGFLSTIHSEGRQMSRLIDDMLFLSQSDAHSFPVNPERTDIDTLLLDSFEAFEPMAKEKRISLSVSLPETAVPSCLCDGERLKQVIAILLHNALSYTPAGGLVLLSLEPEIPESFTVKVIDNGIGIPDEEKAKIFRRFYRSDPSRSAKDHFGLGLSIALEIVRALGGSIRIEDTPGGGSTFLVRLPYSRAKI